MSNNYFQFKQFSIQQDQCAMKVCTDACLFGAYVAHELQERKINAILDIGTGTGLLSLMLAQKTFAPVDAVEIDDSAFTQATANSTQSPWKEKVHIHHSDITAFIADKKYDFIISNPPFLKDDLQSGDAKRNAAKHDSTLTLELLLENTGRLLAAHGSFAILLPWHRVAYFGAEAFKMNFHLSHSVLVKQTPAHPYFRGILIFSRIKSHIHSSEMTIKNEAGEYSAAFTKLLKDYYLYL